MERVRLEQYLTLCEAEMYYRECTYTFSPRSGLIDLHTVNSIHPAPSETVYATFQKALSKMSLAGIGGPSGQGKGAMSVTSGKRDEAG